MMSSRISFRKPVLPYAPASSGYPRTADAQKTTGNPMPTVTRPSPRRASPPPVAHQDKLGDFTADRRILVLIGMALVVGAGGAFAAAFLVKLIALVTNLVWFHRLSTTSVSLAGAT